MGSLIMWAVLSVALPFDGPIIRTAVGTGEKGDSGDGGPARSARLHNPFDVAFDAQGSLYFSDTFNHRVRKVDAKTGVVSTVAGSGAKGFSGDEGPATRATLNEPYGLVVDRAGNLYVADRLNQRVRRVEAATGVITTVAGNGEKQFSGDGGPAGRAGLAEPNGVALDPTETRLFIADVADHRVRVVDLKSGVIETFAGTGKGRHSGDGGPARDAGIFGARAVEVGADGAVYILERQGNSLRKVDPKTGLIANAAGTGDGGFTGDGGPATAATFNGPKEFCIDAAGNIYIVDTENQAIRRIDAGNGTITTLAGNGQNGGSGDEGPARSARLGRPHGVAVGPNGNVYIGDTENHRVRVVEPK